VNFQNTSYKDQIIEALSSFEYIGVRDSCTLKNISNIYAGEIHLNCDPTFLNPIIGNKESGYRILHDKFHVDTKKKIVVLMCHDGAIAKYVKELHPDVEIVSLYEYDPQAHMNPSITPFEWVDIISASHFVITHFFHCACFAINNNVPFYAVEIRKCAEEDSKVFDLLKRSGLLDRFSLGFDRAYTSGRLKDVMGDTLYEGMQVDFSEPVEQVRNLSQSFLDFLNGLN
jgi:hypothetical protein